MPQLNKRKYTTFRVLKYVTTWFEIKVTIRLWLLLELGCREYIMSVKCLHKDRNMSLYTAGTTLWTKDRRSCVPQADNFLTVCVSMWLPPFESDS